MNFIDRVKETWRFYRSGKSIAEVGHAFSSWLNGASNVAFGWQFKAAKLLGETVGNATFRLYRIKADGSWSELDSHPVLDLLHKPNPISTHSELLEMVSMSLDFYGNAYVYMDGADSPTSKPKALYFLKAQNVTIVRTDSFPESIIAYKYRHKSREYIFQPHQILHIRESNPDDPLIGFGAVQAMSDSVDLDQSARQWNRAFFRNSARPDLILKSKFKTREQMDPIRMQFEDWTLRVQAQNPEREEAEEEVEINYSGGAMEIGFNASYLRDALGALGGELAKLSFADASSSCLIEEAEGQGGKHVIMPMRL
jgi:phage portal protein BeeE